MSLQNASHNEQQKVKVYLRNHEKIAKIMNFPPNISAKQLFHQSSINYKIPIENIHLFYGGNPINPEDIISLENNTIIHVVNVQRLKLDSITISVKRLEGSTGSVKFQTTKGTLIRQFIDEQLYNVFGTNSKEVFLVYVGRLLDISKTFQEEQVESQSELICISYNPPEQETPTQTNQAKYPTTTGENMVISWGLRDSSFSSKYKPIYPTPDFPIEIPQQVETSNRLHLIFDSKIRKSSSIQDIDFAPDDVIQQEEYLDFINKNSYHSEPRSDQNDVVRHHSQIYESPNKGHRPGDQTPAKHKKLSAYEMSEKDKQQNNPIFEEDYDKNKNRDMMKDLINEYRSLANAQLQKAQKKSKED